MNSDVIASLAAPGAAAGPVAVRPVAVGAPPAGDAPAGVAGKLFVDTLDAEMAPRGTPRGAVGDGVTDEVAESPDALLDRPVSDLASELAALAALLVHGGPVEVAGESGEPTSAVRATDVETTPTVSPAGQLAVADASAAILDGASGEAAFDPIATQAVDESPRIAPPDLGPEATGEVEETLQRGEIPAAGVGAPDAVESAPTQVEAASDRATTAARSANSRVEDAGSARPETRVTGLSAAGGATNTPQFAGADSDGLSHDAASDGNARGPAVPELLDPASARADASAVPDLAAARAGVDAAALANDVTATASLESPGEPVPVDAVPARVEWLAARGGGTARIALDPPGLGQMEISVSVRGDRVDIVLAAQPEAAKVLHAAREAFGSSLAGLDLRMDRFEVRAPGASGPSTGNGELSLANGQTGQFARNDGDGADPRAGRNADWLTGGTPYARAGETGRGAAIARAAMRPGGTGAVDLRI